MTPVILLAVSLVAVLVLLMVGPLLVARRLSQRVDRWSRRWW